MQGVVMCARFAFSPEMGAEADTLYNYVLNKKDDERAKALIKKFSVYTLLRLISGKNQMDAFDPKVIESYWIGSDLLNEVGAEELGLIIKNYGFVINKEVDKLIFQNLMSPIEQRLAPHHSLSVMLAALRLKEFNPDIIEQISESLITWGTITDIQSDSLIVSRAKLTKPDAYVIEENITDCISYDPAFVGTLQQGDIIAIHHGMAITPLSLLQLAALKRFTERNIGVFNKLA